MSDQTLSLKRALAAIDKLKARLETVESQHREPIAVVGLSCRFPGAATEAEFWDVLEKGRDSTGPAPQDREKLQRGGFLADIQGFDSGFFRITREEAVAMDPQQRLLLEVAWEALENACIPSDRLFESNAGVYIGACSMDYALWRVVNANPGEIGAYFATGTALSVIAGRLAYFLGLTGPAMTIDTACSSSLVAVHQACSALRMGECDLALAGGVSLLLAPEYTASFMKANMLAADGRCKTFDADADGFARSEGCGIVVLKRLHDANRDGDLIRALIPGSAVNQDGASGGLTVPSGPSQEAVIRKALHAASREGRQIDYVEAHGTGTALGDPIEIRALNEVFGGRDRPLAVGSVKTNIGHCEAAAGIAGLIKCVLAIESGVLPGHLHLNRPNPHLDLRRLPITVPERSRPWPGVTGEPRRAGVSAFGFSGTNAHLILEQAPDIEFAQASLSAPVFTLSANDPAALREIAALYALWLASNSGISLSDLCGALWRGRTHLPFRLAVVPRDLTELRRDLQAFSETGVARNVITGSAHVAPKVAFLVSGNDDSGLRRRWLDYGVEPDAIVEAQETRRYLAEGFRIFIEIGPSARLSSIGRRLDRRATAAWLPSTPRRFYRALAHLHVHGYELRMSALAPDPWKRLRLPTYPFQRRRHWLEAATRLERRNQDAPHTLDSLNNWLIDVLAETIGTDISAIDPNRGFAELGVDSLAATILLDRVRDTLRVDVPITAVFNYPRVPEFADYLLRQLQDEPNSMEVAHERG